MQEISFFEQFEWDEERGAMKFWAKVDGEPRSCWITEKALQAFGGNGNSETTNLEFFTDNTEAIHSIARHLIRFETSDENSQIVIDAEACKRLKP